MRWRGDDSFRRLRFAAGPLMGVGVVAAPRFALGGPLDPPSHWHIGTLSPPPDPRTRVAGVAVAEACPPVIAPWPTACEPPSHRGRGRGRGRSRGRGEERRIGEAGRGAAEYIQWEGRGGILVLAILPAPVWASQY